LIRVIKKEKEKRKNCKKRGKAVGKENTIYMLREWKRGGLALHFCIEFGDFGKWRQTKKAMFPPLSLLSLYILLIKTFKTQKKATKKKRKRESPNTQLSVWETPRKKLKKDGICSSLGFLRS
jgi:hypothetical protein